MSKSIKKQPTKLNQMIAMDSDAIIKLSDKDLEDLWGGSGQPGGEEPGDPSPPGAHMN